MKNRRHEIKDTWRAEKEYRSRETGYELKWMRDQVHKQRKNTIATPPSPTNTNTIPHMNKQTNKQKNEISWRNMIYHESRIVQ